MNIGSNFFPSGLVLTKPIIFGVLLVAFVAWGCMSAVFVFHWRRYGMKERFVVIAESVYFLISALLIAVSIVLFFTV